MTLFQMFTLLTVLIAALDLRVSGETVITCDGNMQRLTCATGLIQVSSTEYGRTNPNICPSSTKDQCVRTNCVSRTSVIADRCNGQKVCVIDTESVRLPDPCPGTYKYYTTTYTCVAGTMAVICEDNSRTLSCGGNVIQILNANYGRDDSTVCLRGYACRRQSTSCYAAGAHATVSSLCNGRTTCTLEASNRVFTDPCVGTSKYLTVSYRCNPTVHILPPPVYNHLLTCEGQIAVLTCGVQRIKISRAIYGRTDSTSCVAGRPGNQISNTNCNAPSTQGVMVARCEGKNRCEVPATNDIFSDPCFGTYKFLSVLYQCI